MTIDFKGKVAIVTGAGGGLGRCHAIELAKRGAKVVVNDLGQRRRHRWKFRRRRSSCRRIKAAGGTAMANGASVSDDAAWIILSSRRWMAGVSRHSRRNSPLSCATKASQDGMKDFDAVMQVHLMGTVKPCKALWETFKKQQYGRIVVTPSSTGLYGNFGQTNYGAAKLSLVGFMNTLKLEGAKDNIKVNAIGPVAGTRMTENLMPPNVLEMLKPEYVTPGVVFLVSEDAPTGMILTAAAGVFAAAQLVETDGVNLGHNAATDDVTDGRS
jgi:NAD(P)-dependent dehydrogenase (short-subunit alcohol dehydrogenase family)